MKRFLKRRIWMLPVWALLVLALTTAALAGWVFLAVRDVTTDISASTFGPFSVAPLSVVSGTCTVALNGGDIHITWAGVSPGDGCTIDVGYNNDHATVDAYGVFAEETPDAAIDVSDLTCGLLVPAQNGSPVDYRLSLSMNNGASPGGSYAPIYSIGFYAEQSEALAACLP